MKKFVVLLMFLFVSNSFVWAYDVDLTRDGKDQKKIMEIGFGILNANKIDKRIIFVYEHNKQANAFARDYDKSVIIYRGLLPYIDDEAELAGVLSHEIAHNVDYYHGYLRMLAMEWAPKKYEEKADKKAVDYMVNAGYDPLALIVVMNKFCGQNRTELMSTHPLTSRRLAYIYQYIYQKYPAYLVDNEYKTNLYYQNFLLTSRKDREEIRDKNLINVSNKKQKS